MLVAMALRDGFELRGMLDRIKLGMARCVSRSLSRRVLLAFENSCGNRSCSRWVWAMVVPDWMFPAGSGALKMPMYPVGVVGQREGCEAVLLTSGVAAVGASAPWLPLPVPLRVAGVSCNGGSGRAVRARVVRWFGVGDVSEPDNSSCCSTRGSRVVCCR